MGGGSQESSCEREAEENSCCLTRKAVQETRLESSIPSFYFVLFMLRVDYVDPIFHLESS